MPKLDRLPEKSIIRGLRGILDFYVHKSQPMVRTWPNKPAPYDRKQTQPTLDLSRDLDFTFHTHTKCVRDVWKANAASGSWTWRDLAYRFFFGTHFDRDTFDRYSGYNYGLYYPPGKTWKVPRPDPLQRYWTVTRILSIGTGFGGLIKFELNGAPPHPIFINGPRPPKPVQEWRTRRGEDIFCGYTWQWPRGTRFNSPHPIYSDPNAPASGVRLGFGNAIRFVQLVSMTLDNGYIWPCYGPLVMVFEPFVVPYAPNFLYISPYRVTSKAYTYELPFPPLPGAPPPWDYCDDFGVVLPP